MNRRGFLKTMGGVFGGVALDQAIPLGRVWSFPSKIVVPSSTVGIDYGFEPDYAAVYALRTEQIVFLQVEALIPYIPQLVERHRKLHEFFSRKSSALT